MPQQIVIAEHLRIAALLTDERIDELIVAQGSYQIGDIFLGTVENVLPGIDAAFVNIGESEKNGFIHVNDLGPLRLKKATAGITELLEPRQKVLVQVMKEPTGSKGPRLTGNIALPGRYLVLQPYGQGVNISRRISTESERNRLRALGVLVKPPSTGLLIRTEAEDISEEFLIDDLENLLKQWELIQQASESCTPPILLNRDEDFIHRILRDHTGQNITQIVVDNTEAIGRVESFLGKDSKELTIELHSDSENILEKYKVISSINNALKPRVDLPSGGYIIIEPTEALTVIDVNSGSFTRSANSRETVLWTNCEAAIEIARQLKLRNIGGVIIIDFIDMDTKRDQLQLLEHFTSAINGDSARPQIASLTELGLVELTRKRQGQNIYELFGKTSPNSQGQSYIPNITIQDINPSSPSEIGVINSTLISGEDIQALEENNVKKKRLNKVIDIETNLINEEHKLSTDNSKPISMDTITEDIPKENNKRKETTIINVKMNQNEENLYSLMGLDPILLLEKPPLSENYKVNIIRPGEEESREEKNQIPEDNQQKIVNNPIGNHQNNNKDIIRLKNKNNIEQKSTNSDEKESIQEENINVDIGQETNELININYNSLSEKDESTSTESKEVSEDPRRKRRRSSAS
ncbi:Rne/Rng family ribonuclease [Prochlorococcus sp. MIT 0801]|uniref:Rne/Rng family ribonuclease n=1 Tax=Prochlorococcus sp. MIT 0801 TaxID=1501269 RepID=UPI0004F7AA27|nr:Rne/Rng family ribonuclease [Prochlorococcus sp. MIT 0801]AIQ98098.1 Cytoplasmic axial filament protein CafA and Ribonuclease G Ribonuclease E [Prochlorococcus sp. MIT 0801]